VFFRRFAENERLVGEDEPWIGHGPRSWSPIDSLASNPASLSTCSMPIRERTSAKSIPGMSHPFPQPALVANDAAKMSV
jgi:hypothetical protein